MHPSQYFLTSSFAALAAAQVQGSAPPPVLLNATKSGVLPVLPTPFNGVETIEGAIIDAGPVNSTFAGLNGPAVAQTSGPQTTYSAELPSSMFNPYVGTTISGRITGVGTDQGVQITLEFNNLPDASYGPFGYHIHGLPVPSDGNCTSTLGHLDPTNRGEYWFCDTANPQTCQAGDLAGKHGKIAAVQTFKASYLEPYLSTDPSSPYFFGDKSIVIHTGNTTRLTCANFMLSNSDGSNSTTGTPSPTGGSGTGSPSPTGGTAPTMTSNTPTVPTAAATKMVSSMLGCLIAVLVAAVMT